MYTFDGTHFHNTRGIITSVYAKQTRAGRWQYRDTQTNKVIASGVTPAAFVASYWFGTLEETE